MDVLRYVQLNQVLTIAAAAVLIATLSSGLVMAKAGRACGFKVLMTLLLAGAVLCTLDLTLGSVLLVSGPPDPFAGVRSVNLVPLVGIWDQVHNLNPRLGAANLIGNVLLFVPITVCATLLAPRDTRTAWSVVGLSVGIEFVQYLVGRTADIDDVLLNAVGIFVTYAIVHVAVDRLSGQFGHKGAQGGHRTLVSCAGNWLHK